MRWNERRNRRVTRRPWRCQSPPREHCVLWVEGWHLLSSPSPQQQPIGALVSLCMQNDRNSSECVTPPRHTVLKDVVSHVSWKKYVTTFTLLDWWLLYERGDLTGGNGKGKIGGRNHINMSNKQDVWFSRVNRDFWLLCALHFQDAKTLSAASFLKRPGGGDRWSACCQSNAFYIFFQTFPFHMQCERHESLSVPSAFFLQNILTETFLQRCGNQRACASHPTCFPSRLCVQTWRKTARISMASVRTFPPSCYCKEQKGISSCLLLGDTVKEER